MEHNPNLAFLLDRHSDHALSAPGPSAGELELILKAALRAPDFGHLRPYRFLIASDAGRERLGAALQRGATAAGKDEKIIRRAPGMPLRAPLVIVVVASPKADKNVPVYDQELCAASAVLMMQLAARALGYGGMWRSGWPMYQAEVAAELGVAAHERIVGYLYVGSADAESSERAADPEPETFVSWL